MKMHSHSAGASQYTALLKIGMKRWEKGSRKSKNGTPTSGGALTGTAVRMLSLSHSFGGARLCFVLVKCARKGRENVEKKDTFPYLNGKNDKKQSNIACVAHGTTK